MDKLFPMVSNGPRLRAPRQLWQNPFSWIFPAAEQNRGTHREWRFFTDVYPVYPPKHNIISEIIFNMIEYMA